MSEGSIFSAVCVLLIALIIGGAIYETREWERFKVQHECKVVTQVSGDWINTVSLDSKGNPVVGMTRTPDKTGWLCDDGITYYR